MALGDIQIALMPGRLTQRAQRPGHVVPVAQVAKDGKRLRKASFGEVGMPHERLEAALFDQRMGCIQRQPQLALDNEVFLHQSIHLRIIHAGLVNDVCQAG